MQYFSVKTEIKRQQLFQTCHHNQGKEAEDYKQTASNHQLNKEHFNGQVWDCKDRVKLNVSLNKYFEMSLQMWQALLNAAFHRV